MSEMFERCSTELVRECRNVVRECATVGATLEVRSEHPRLELRQLAVELTRDLRACPVAHNRHPNDCHVKF
jgi:hypothetical protein